MTLQLDVAEYERRLREHLAHQDKGLFKHLGYWRGREDGLRIALNDLKDMMNIEGWKRAHEKRFPSLNVFNKPAEAQDK